MLNAAGSSAAIKPDTLSPPDGLPLPQRYWAMAAIILGISMSVLDGTIVNLALPAITRDTHASAVLSIWVVNAYQLATLMVLLPCAMVGDLLGHRRVYLVGLLLFTIASLGCALSTSLPMLIGARTLQGLGAGGLMAVNAALLRLVYPARLLGRGVAINSFVVATSSVAGPTIAGAILSITSWPWLFAVNLPLGVIVLWLGRRALPMNATRPPQGARLSPLDVVLNALMFGLLFLGAETLGTHAAGNGSHGNAELGVALIAAGSLVGVFYVRRQLTQTVPLFPLDLLRIPVFALSMGTSITAFAAQVLSYIALPFLLLEGLGRSHAETGLLITAWPLGTVIAAPVAGRLIGRIPDGLLGAVGLATMATGLALLATLPHEPTNVTIAWRLALCGIGFGLFQSPNNHTIVTAAPPRRSGGASGMLGSARLTGQTIGALLVAVVFSSTGAHDRRGPTVALVIAAVFSIVAAGFSGLRVRQPALRHVAPSSIADGTAEQPRPALRGD